jgi:hypothetical protein
MTCSLTGCEAVVTGPKPHRWYRRMVREVSEGLIVGWLALLEVAACRRRDNLGTLQKKCSARRLWGRQIGS